MSNVSFGVFPSASAVKSRSTSDLQALYYATTVKRNHCGRKQEPEDIGENFDAIHKMGQKNTKYMKYQIKKAPLVDRSACKYHQEFVPKPLGDCVCNKELAKTFKGGLVGGKVQQNPSFGKSSRYKDDFCMDLSPKARRSAKAESQGPHRKARTQTLGGTGDMLELTSNSHEHLIAHPQKLAKAQEILIPKPNLTLAGRCNSDAFKTNYSMEFGDPIRNQARRLQSYGQGSLTNFDEMFKDMKTITMSDDDSHIFQTRRACFLSPGS